LNIASGKNVDIDFQLMIEKSKFKEKMISAHQSNGEAKLAVTVRKRPIFKK
jgi:kinesin family protein 2/24